MKETDADAVEVQEVGQRCANRASRECARYDVQDRYGLRMSPVSRNHSDDPILQWNQIIPTGMMCSNAADEAKKILR